MLAPLPKLIEALPMPGRDYFTVRLRDGRVFCFTGYDFSRQDEGIFEFYRTDCDVPFIATTRDLAEIDFRYAT